MQDDPTEDRLVTHLLTVMSVSAGLVGVCLTAIGLIGMVKTLNRAETVCDDLMAADAIIFLVAALVGFAGLRTPLRRHCARVATAVDVIFCLGLAVMVLACVLLAWTVI